MAKRLSSSVWRPRSQRKIASSSLIAITVLSLIFLSLWVWNFVELFGLLRFSRFMGCWKFFGIFWVVHVLVCGDFSCSYICESALDGGKEIVAGLWIIDQQSPCPSLKKKKKGNIIFFSFFLTFLFTFHLSFSLSFATVQIRRLCCA